MAFTQECVEQKFKEKNLIILGKYIDSITKILCKCYCGTKFMVVPSQVFRGRTKSCGCLHSIYRNKDLTNIKFNRLLVIEKDSYIKGNRNGIFWKCLCDCGKICRVTTGRLTNNNTKSCGCLLIEKAKQRLFEEIHPKQIGQHSWNYRFDLSDDERIDRRFLPENKLWTQNILKFDNYKCILCKSNKKICAHHMDGYHWCKERRLDLSNGVTLCNKCHKNFHSEYGIKNNTEEQFKEYMLCRSVW